MGAFGVIEGHPVFDDASGLEAVGDFLKVDRLLLQASPEPFDEDVVEVTTPAIHRDADPGLCQRRDPGRSRELAAPVIPPKISGVQK